LHPTGTTGHISWNTSSVIISFVHGLCPVLVTLAIIRTRVVYCIPTVPLAVDTIQTVRPTGIVILLPRIHLISHDPRSVKDQLSLYQTIRSDEHALPTSRSTGIVHGKEHVVGRSPVLVQSVA